MIEERIESLDLMRDRGQRITKGGSCLKFSIKSILREWLQVLTEKPINMIYQDFSKAFETVLHKRLIYWVNKYGIGRDTWFD